MWYVILLPIVYRLWTLRSLKPRFYIDASVLIALFIILFVYPSIYIELIILLLCLYLDSRRENVLLIVFLGIALCSWNQAYYLYIWVLIEMVFVLHHKFLSKSYEDEMQEYQAKVFDRQVQEVDHMFMTMRGWRHDYHNHLQNLKAKLQQNDIVSSIQYLDSLENELKDIRLLVESGNTNMDAILNSKLSLAIYKEIQLHVKASAPAQLSISDTDICALLGNLIDNAVEACDKVKGERFIRLYVGKYKGQLYISCTNTTNEVVRKVDEQYISKKRGNHGHGLKRMNLIVKKYEGYINRKNEPGVFVTEIMLPL